MMRYIDINKGMEVEFEIATGKKGKRTRTEEDPFAPISRTHGTGTVIGRYPHFVAIQMQDGQTVTIQRIDLIHTKKAVIRPAKKSSPTASLFQPDAVT